LQGLYAAPAWWGFLNVAEKDRIESLINKAKRYGYLASDIENVHTLVEIKTFQQCSV